MPYVSRGLRALEPNVPRALLFHVPRVLRALVLHMVHVLSSLHTLMLHVPHALHALLLTTMISNLVRKEFYYNGFFISDRSLQDPLIYVNLFTLIHQPAFTRKQAF